jgi:predicted phage terminase large subunit-like protein
MVHIERTGFQLALIQQARRDGMAVKELRADRDKISRSLPLQARMEAGNVWFPRDAPWMGELQRELLAFPNAAHDDQVDALAYAAVLVGQPNREWRFG